MCLKIILIEKKIFRIKIKKRQSDIFCNVIDVCLIDDIQFNLIAPQQFRWYCFERGFAGQPCQAYTYSRTSPVYYTVQSCSEFMESQFIPSHAYCPMFIINTLCTFRSVITFIKYIKQNMQTIIACYFNYSFKK